MKKKERVAVDLFSGAGGVSCGLKQAGIDVRAAVEIWDVAADTYEYNLGKQSVIRKDIREVTGKEILKKINIRKGQLFLLAGCPPCQGFSSQQKNKLGEKDERNMLVFEYIRIISEIKPLLILMENVPGMKKESNIFKRVIESLDKIGYVIKYDIINAADYGVPQMRRRLVVHGIRNDIFSKLEKRGLEFQLPLPKYINPRKKNNNDKLEPWKTVRDSISKYPKLDVGTKHHVVPNHICADLWEINKERMRYIRNNGGDRNSLPDELKLKCHKKEKVGYGDVYGIMKWDSVAPTLTGGCLSYSKGRFGHPEQERAISAREAASLQTFDDKYIFKGKLVDLATQIGNAVPVKLAYASGEYFVELGKKLKIID